MKKIEDENDNQFKIKLQQLLDKINIIVGFSKDKTELTNLENIQRYWKLEESFDEE